MAAVIPSAETCCNQCDEQTSVAVPGPSGDDGVDGANGTDGVNAFTTTTAQFTMPAVDAEVTVSVVNSDWASVGQVVYVKVGGSTGYFEIISIPNSTSLELENLGYDENSIAATIFASGAKVSPAGPKGVDGTPASGQITVGTGSPEGAVSATGPHFYFKEDAPIALWFKPSGTGTSGWIELISA